MTDPLFFSLIDGQQGLPGTTLHRGEETPINSRPLSPDALEFLREQVEQSWQEEQHRLDQQIIADMWTVSGETPAVSGDQFMKLLDSPEATEAARLCGDDVRARALERTPYPAHQELFRTANTPPGAAQAVIADLERMMAQPIVYSPTFHHPQVLRDLQTLAAKEPRMLIGIYSPKPQSGKTTAADALVLAGFNHQRFAGPMKDMARTVLAALGVPETGLYRGDKEELVYRDRTLRHLLQTLGTEWGRKCMGEDFWVDLWRARVEAAGGLIVADDMRFPNEYRAIKALGGVVWRVTRPDNTSPTNGHASEGALDGLPFDLELVNDGTLDQFRAKVDAAVRIAKEVA